MVQRAEILEKFFGRRVVSCLGVILLLIVLLMVAALIFGKRSPPPKEGESTPAKAAK